MSRLLLPLCFGLLVCCIGTVTWAQSTPPSADFDALPQGPWLDPLLSGSPNNMGIFAVTNAVTLYPFLVPPGATGNLLRVDNSGPTVTEDAILRFEYSCSPGPSNSDCRLGFGWAAWTFADGHGVEFFVDDDGSYTNPFFVWHGNFGPGDLEDGTLGAEFHDAPNCSSTHLLEIVVQTESLLILDGVTAECLGAVSTEAPGFGTWKSRFQN